MKMFDVTFVLTSVAHKHIRAESVQQLRDYLESEYGIGDDYYGPVSEKLFGLLSEKIKNGEFYVTCHFKGFEPQYTDEIAHNKEE